MQTVNLFGTADDSIVDGPGIRFAVFVQGCPHDCLGCHNQEAIPLDGGVTTDVEQLWQRIEANPLISGITLSGGEPFTQPKPLIELANLAHAKGLNVWAYSGYLYEELLADIPSNAAHELLEVCDVLVDGRYIQSQASYDLSWRGSANQRVIDVPASLEAGKVVTIQ